MIDGKKVLQSFIWVMIAIILFYVSYRFLSSSSVAPISYPAVRTLPKKGKIPLHVYQNWIEESLPHMKKAESSSNNKLLFLFINWLMNIDLQNQATLFENVIPTMTYVHDKQKMQQSELVEVYPRIQHQEVINQNDEETYKIDFFEVPPPVITTPQVPLEVSDENLQNLTFLKKYLYTAEGNLELTMNEYRTDVFLKKDFKLAPAPASEPKILIFHTHSQEDFRNPEGGTSKETVVQLGQVLTNILRNQYGIGVVHDTTSYDMVNGKGARNSSYDRVDKAIPVLLKKYPTIEVVIDLHRDGLNENIHLVTSINDKPTAKIMFVNGICKIMSNGTLKDIGHLSNPYLEDNMAFSFQMQLKANELYPGLMRKIYIKPYRYSLHMKPRSLLVEVGAQTNTYEEAYNAMEPLAHILMSVLKEEG